MVFLRERYSILGTAANRAVDDSCVALGVDNGACRCRVLHIVFKGVAERSREFPIDPPAFGVMLRGREADREGVFGMACVEKESNAGPVQEDNRIVWGRFVARRGPRSSIVHSPASSALGRPAILLENQCEGTMSKKFDEYRANAKMRG